MYKKATYNIVLFLHNCAYYYNFFLCTKVLALSVVICDITHIEKQCNSHKWKKTKTMEHYLLLIVFSSVNKWNRFSAILADKRQDTRKGKNKGVS